MRKQMHFLETALLTIFLAQSLISVADATPIVKIDPDNQPFWKEVSVYIDKTGEARFEDILSKDFRSLRQPAVDTPTNAIIWFRFPLENSTPYEQNKILSVIVRRNLYTHLWMNKGNGWELTGGINYRNLYEFPSAPSTIPYIQLNIPSGKTEVLVAVKNRKSGEVALELWPAREFWKRVSDDSTIYGLFIAICLVMVLYNLALFSSLRDSIYLYYSGYIFFGTMFFPLRDHYYSTWFDINLLGLFEESGNTIIILLPLTASMLFLAFYIFRFLDLTFDSTRKRALKYAILTFPVLFSLLQITHTLIPQQANTKIVILTAQNVFVLFFVLLLLSVITYAGIKGPEKSRGRWLLITTGVAITGAILETLRTLGYLPDSFRFSIHIGVAFEIIMLSIYMQHRVNQLRRDKELAQSALLESTAREAERLEKVVKKRTKELDLKVEELAASNAAKDKFFSLLAHDLRGPIGNLSIMLDMARKKEIQLDNQVLHELHESTDNTLTLMEELLAWGRNQKGMLEVAPSNFQVAQLINKAVHVLSEQARRKGIKLNFESDETVYGYADIAMIGTVVRNLVSNAIKFTPSHGAVTITTARVNDAVLIYVKDTGVGFSEERGAKLFRLKQLGESTSGTQQEKGTGMGLILCKEFIEINNGKIGFRSTHGKGSEFWFTLPTGNSQNFNVSKQNITKQAMSYRSQLVTLLVEDNHLNLETQQLVLSRLGITPHIAKTGLAAIDATNKTDFNLILMDIDLPEINGIEAARRIKSHDGKAPFIVAVSSFSKTEIIQSGSDVFDDYLEKPLKEEMLITVLNEVSRRMKGLGNTPINDPESI